MNNRSSLLLFVIAIGAIIAVKYMVNSVVPYVPFSQAREKGEYVQIIGTPDAKKGLALADKGITFTLNDKTGSIVIYYEGEKPLNLENAEKVVAMGIFDKEHSRFNADKLLTKCPSKYEKKKDADSKK
jgi:cytochrome c-type biogenesis protein CcmE